MIKRQAKRAPAKRRVFFFAGFVFKIWQRFITADIQRAKNHRLVARCVHYITIESLLTFALGQCGGDEELELGPEKADAFRTGRCQSRHVVAQASVDHQRDWNAVFGDGRFIAHRCIARLFLLPINQVVLENFFGSQGWPHNNIFFVCI